MDNGSHNINYDAMTHQSTATQSGQRVPHIATLILLAGISALAMNLFLPSLPGMAVYFDVDYTLIQLSVALFLGVNAALQLLIGPVTDKYGRRPVVLWGLGLFVLATIGCLLAPNAYVFLTFRMMQAVVAVGIVLSRAIVQDIYPADQSASMMGYVTMGMSVVPMLAPALGGILDALFGWHASFVVLALSGSLLLWLCWRDLPETATPSGNSLLQQIAEYPELLRSPRFWGYSLSAAFSSGAFFAYIGGAPFVAKNIFGMSPQEMGLYFATPGLGYFFGNWASGAYSQRMGKNPMIVVGCLIVLGAVLTTFIISLFGLSTPITFFGVMIFVGLGNGMVIPNASAGMLAVRPHLAGTASGLGAALMIGGGAAWSGLAGAMLTEGSSERPLLFLMAFSGILAVACIHVVIWREKHVSGNEAI